MGDKNKLIVEETDDLEYKFENGARLRFMFAEGKIIVGFGDEKILLDGFEK